MFFSAFFSSLETGLLALGEAKIRKWAKSEIKSLDIWLKDPTGIITGILVGNNLVNISFSAIFTVLVVHFIKLWDVNESWIEMISILFSSTAILILGEIIPKTFANVHPDKIVNICLSTSEERVDKQLDKLKELKEKQKQKGLDKWF